MIHAERLPETSWQQHNYASLLAEIDVLKTILRSKLPNVLPGSREGQTHEAIDKSVSVLQADQQAVAHALATTTTIVNTRSNLGAYPARDHQAGTGELKQSSWQSSVMLNRLCELFALSLFDRQLLLLCLAAELDGEVPNLCMQLTQQAYPSMALALILFDGHCSTMAADAPLAYFKLIEPRRDNSSFMRRALVISEWALCYLCATPALDPALTQCLHPIAVTEPRLPTHLKCAQALRHSLRCVDNSSNVVQVISATEDDRRQVAALFAQHEEREIYAFSLYQLPMRINEQRIFLSILEREIISRQCLVLIDCQRLVSSDEAKTDTHLLRNGLAYLLRDLPKAFCLSASEQVVLPQVNIHYHEVPALSREEQLMLWQHCLPESEDNEMHETLSALTHHYSLTGRQVRSIAHSARIQCETSTEGLQENLWQHSREQSRQDLQGLAQVVSPGNLSWEDLILAEKEKNTLQSLVSQCKQRQKVYHQWGFAKQVSYGLGICALFAGGSGTGKTMAARIIASSLNLDLYHVDLSSVVDKYIGETEKKLDKLFLAAENSGAVLLFDEADALFGKRTKVQDAKDRYANMGVSFLLQRIERYSGLSILTTNFRGAMDSAFTRRLRFIVQFPFPSAQERQDIWQRMMPADAPTENIHYEKLARLVLAGGAIRNITLHAAFLAAEAEQAISMAHLLRAVRQEYIKAEKTLDLNLVKDW